MRQLISYSQTLRNYGPVRMEELYNILIAYGVPTKVVGFIKIYLHKTYSKVGMGKQLSDTFLIQNGRKQERRCFIVIAIQFCFRIILIML
jgi:hypothetical protein